MTIQKSTPTVKFVGSLTISRAAEMQRILLDAIRGLDAIREPNPPSLDLSEVEQCDAAAAQVLCSALKTAAAQGCRFHLLEVSEAVALTFATLGLPLQELAERRTLEGSHSAS
jgi:anti-anti-sigma factor